MTNAAAKKKKDDENETAGVSWDFPSKRQDESTQNMDQGNQAILWRIYSTSTVFRDFFVVDIFVY